jgi:hypothetical protein
MDFNRPQAFLSASLRCGTFVNCSWQDGARRCSASASAVIRP